MYEIKDAEPAGLQKECQLVKLAVSLRRHLRRRFHPVKSEIRMQQLDLKQNALGVVRPHHCRRLHRPLLHRPPRYLHRWKLHRYHLILLHRHLPQPELPASLLECACAIFEQIGPVGPAKRVGCKIGEASNFLSAMFECLSNNWLMSGALSSTKNTNDTILSFHHVNPFLPI
jgi:hypothetical protein